MTLTRGEAFEICNVIERVETRCMAADGPVTPTSEEIRADETQALARLSGWNFTYTTPTEKELRALYQEATRRLAEP
jgi:hypothetical protein